MDIRQVELSEWGDGLPDSGYGVFHRPAALSVLEDHTADAELRLYGGFKGQETMALLPVFVRELPLGGRIVSSPPPGMHVPHLGPIVMPTSPKQRKRERVNQLFTEEMFAELGDDSRTLFYMICSPDYDDPRPFEWADQSVEVSFTYHLPVGDDDPESVLGTFSKSRRREIRTGADLDLSVERGGIADLRAVYEQAERRLAEQEEYLGVSWPFVRGLFSALGDRARVYVARAPNGEFLSGIVTLESRDTVSYWLGGFRANYENISANTLLHWGILRDIVEDTELEPVTRYDMVGASEYRLSRYKSKFNPELRKYYVINSGGKLMDVAKRVYQTVGRVSSPKQKMSSVLQ